MANFLAIITALIWYAGTVIRVYRQARFYQIDEYKSPRYLRWLSAERGRWLPGRPVAAWFVGAAAGFLLSEAPGSALPGIIAMIAAIVAVWPPDEGEIKKAFVRTARAKRILGTAFAVAAVIMLAGLGLVQGLALSDMGNASTALIGLVGLIVYLLAPLALMGGNIAMKPVEAFFRQRFLARARGVLDAVQPKVIGITGSYGKTTTKTILAHILNGRYRAYATPKSYNTTMGVCLAINTDIANDYSIEYFIAEMGAYVPGEIAEICDLVHPDIGIIIEVGPQHLERFGTLENTATAKYELIKALPPDGTAVFNWDNDYVQAMYERGYPQTRIAVSRQVAPDAVPENGPRLIASNVTETLNGLTFAVTDVQTGSEELFQTPVMGEHNVTNILLATAVALHEGMSLREVAMRVRTLQPAESRLVRQTTAEGITIINDAYSANPVGAVSALRTLGMHTSGKRLLITPGMVELGPLHEPENCKLGETAAQYATDVILVGKEQTRPIADGLRKADFPAERMQTVETLTEAIAWYRENLRAGDTVLFLNDLPDTY